MKKIIAIAFFAILTSTSFGQLGFSEPIEKRQAEQLARINTRDSIFMASFVFDVSLFKKELFEELNRVRKENKRLPVVLTKDTSRINSVDRFVYNSHLVWEKDLAHDPNGGICFETTHYGIISAYDIREQGENYYKFLAKDVLGSLMSSPPHRALLLDSSRKEISIGTASKWLSHSSITNKVVIRLWS
jgi:hypothetical protein